MGICPLPARHPFLARIELALFGTSLIGFRFFPAIASGLVAVLTGLTARAMGGGRQAMLMSAFAASIGGPIFFTGSFMSYMSFDLLWWVTAAWCVARLIESGDARWWLGVGAAIGLGLMTKYTMAFFAVALLGAMLLTPNRRYLRSAWFWCGVALALLLFAPNLWWQYQHHFVSLAWMRSIHARDMGMGRTDHFLLNQLWKTCAVVALPLLFAGFWFLFARPEGRRWRMIGWMYVLTLAGLMAARGRDYYLAPAYPMLLAAGAVWGEQWLGSLPAQKQKRILGGTWRTLGIGGLCLAALMVPVAPVNSAWWRVADAVNEQFNMEIGWPELAATVAHVRDSIPASDRGALGSLGLGRRRSRSRQPLRPCLRPDPRHQRHEFQLASRLRRPPAANRHRRRLQAGRTQPDLRHLPGCCSTLEPVWRRQRQFPRPRPGLRLSQYPLPLAGVLEAFPVLRVEMALRCRGGGPLAAD